MSGSDGKADNALGLGAAGAGKRLGGWLKSKAATLEGHVKEHVKEIRENSKLIAAELSDTVNIDKALQAGKKIQESLATTRGEESDHAEEHYEITISEVALGMEIDLESGARVKKVIQGGPAEQHGVRQNDLLVAVGGEQLPEDDKKLLQEALRRGLARSKRPVTLSFARALAPKSEAVEEEVEPTPESAAATSTAIRPTPDEPSTSESAAPQLAVGGSATDAPAPVAPAVECGTIEPDASNPDLDDTWAVEAPATSASQLGAPECNGASLETAREHANVFEEGDASIASLQASLDQERARLSQLQRAHDDLDAARRALDDRLCEASAARQSLQAELAKAEGELVAARAACAEATQRADRADATLVELRERNESTMNGDSASHAIAVNDLEAALAEAEEQIGRSEAALENERDARASSLHAARRGEEEHREALSDLREAAGERQKELRSELQEAMATADALQQRLQSAEEESIDARAACEEATEHAARAEAECTALSVARHVALESQQESEDRLEAVQRGLGEREVALAAECDERVTSLEATLAGEQRALAELRREHSDVDAAQGQLAGQLREAMASRQALAEELSAAEARLRDASAVASDCREQVAMAAAGDEGVSMVQSALAAEQKRYAELLEVHEGVAARRNEIEGHLREATLSGETLQERLRRVEAEASASSEALKEATVSGEALGDRLRRADADVSTLGERLRLAEADASASSKALGEATSSGEALAERLRLAESDALASCEGLRVELRDAEMEVGVAHARCADAEDHASQAEKEAAQAWRRVEDVQAEYSEKCSDHEKALQHARAAKERMTAMKQDFGEREAALSAKGDGEIAGLMKALADEEQSVRQLQRERSELDVDQAQLAEQLSEAAVAVTSLRGELSEVEFSLHASQSSGNDIKMHLGEVEVQMAEEQQCVKRFEQQCANLVADNANALQRLQVVESNWKAAEQDFGEHESALAAESDGRVAAFMQEAESAQRELGGELREAAQAGRYLRDELEAAKAELQEAELQRDESEGRAAEAEAARTREFACVEQARDECATLERHRENAVQRARGAESDIAMAEQERHAQLHLKFENAQVERCHLDQQLREASAAEAALREQVSDATKEATRFEAELAEERASVERAKGECTNLAQECDGARGQAARAESRLEAAECSQRELAAAAEAEVDQRRQTSEDALKVVRQNFEDELRQARDLEAHLQEECSEMRADHDAAVQRVRELEDALAAAERAEAALAAERDAGAHAESRLMEELRTVELRCADASAASEKAARDSEHARVVLQGKVAAAEQAAKGEEESVMRLRATLVEEQDRRRQFQHLHESLSEELRSVSASRDALCAELAAAETSPHATGTADSPMSSLRALAPNVIGKAAFDAGDRSSGDEHSVGLHEEDAPLLHGREEPSNIEEFRARNAELEKQNATLRRRLELLDDEFGASENGGLESADDNWSEQSVGDAEEGHAGTAVPADVACRRGARRAARKLAVFRREKHIREVETSLRWFTRLLLQNPLVLWAFYVHLVPLWALMIWWLL